VRSREEEDVDYKKRDLIEDPMGRWRATGALAE